MMKVLVTGGHGFVLSVFVAELLRRGDCEVVTADLVPAPARALRYWGDRGRGVRQCVVDVTDRVSVARAIDEHEPDVVVHGATLTQVPGGEAAGGIAFVDVNVLGSANVARAAVDCGSVKRLVTVSSGSVYGPAVREARKLADPVRTPCDPVDLYAISKSAGERVAARICELGGLSNPRLRLANVFGPLEQPTGGRVVMSVPTRLVEADALERPLSVTPRTLDAASDWISSVDVATALTAACLGDDVQSRAYNVATGRCTTVREVIELAGLEVRLDPAADLDMDPDGSSYVHGSDLRYDVRDTAEQLGWSARPIGVQLTEFARWARARQTDPPPVETPLIRTVPAGA